MSENKTVSIDALMSSDGSVFVGLTHPVTGDAIVDGNKVECGFRVTSNKSAACKKVESEIEAATAKLKRGKQLSIAKRRNYTLDMMVAATVEVVGDFEVGGEKVENTPKSIRRVYKKSDVIHESISETVGTPEVFTKGAMELEEE